MSSFIVPEPVRNPNNCYPNLLEEWLPPSGYRPSLAAGITFCILFGILFLGHSVQAICFRSWTAGLLAIGGMSAFCYSLERGRYQHVCTNVSYSSSRDDRMGWSHMAIPLPVQSKRLLDADYDIDYRTDVLYSRTVHPAG